MEIIYYIILVPMVYLAFVIFFVGLVVRLAGIIREPNHPTTLQIYPEKKPKFLWMQEGIINYDAEKLAKENGVEVVMDRCMYKEFLRK